MLLIFLVLSYSGLSQSRVFKDDRIVGGEPIRIEDAPYQVSLQQGYGHICGGTLVSDRHVVTAAHCVGGSGYKIRVGTASLDSGGVLYDVEQTYVHPNYTALDYDVAVLKLKTNVQFNSKVAKIEMVKSGLVIEEGTFVNVVGWGVLSEGGWWLSDSLRRVKVPVLSQESCARKYRGVANITSRMLCAGVESGGKDSCQGDSGGGLTYNGTLAGVVSFGLGCARPGYPGVYSRIAALRTWIDDVISSSAS